MSRGFAISVKVLLGATVCVGAAWAIGLPQFMLSWIADPGPRTMACMRRGAELSDEADILRFALPHSKFHMNWCSLDAARRLTKISSLRTVALSSPDDDVALEALAGLTDQHDLELVAEHGVANGAREGARQVLDVLGTSNAPDLRSLVAPANRAQRASAGPATPTILWPARLAAAVKLHDERLLLELIGTTDDRDQDSVSRHLARTRINPELATLALAQWAKRLPDDWLSRIRSSDTGEWARELASQPDVSREAVTVFKRIADATTATGILSQGALLRIARFHPNGAVRQAAVGRLNTQGARVLEMRAVSTIDPDRADALLADIGDPSLLATVAMFYNDWGLRSRAAERLVRLAGVSQELLADTFIHVWRRSFDWDDIQRTLAEALVGESALNTVLRFTGEGSHGGYPILTVKSALLDPVIRRKLPGATVRYVEFEKSASYVAEYEYKDRQEHPDRPFRSGGTNHSFKGSEYSIRWRGEVLVRIRAEPSIRLFLSQSEHGRYISTEEILAALLADARFSGQDITDLLHADDANLRAAASELLKQRSTTTRLGGRR